MLVATKGGPETPSSRYRIYALLPLLAARGWTIELLTPSTVRSHRFTNLVRDLRLGLHGWDVLLVQRPGRRREETVTLRLAAIRAHVVALDVDDPVERRGAFAVAASRAHVVFAGSSAAAAEHDDAARVELISTPLDPSCYAVQRPSNDPPVIGWIGDGPAYFEALVRMVRSVARAPGPWSLQVVGTKGNTALEQGLREAAPGKSLELVSEIAWEQEDLVAQTVAGFDIGLVPFRNAEGASFKTVQYLAAGAVPLVESGGEGERHVREALGLDAPVVHPGDTDAVAAALARLRDPRVRQELGARGRLAAFQSYSQARAAARIDAILREELDAR